MTDIKGAPVVERLRCAGNGVEAVIQGGDAGQDG